MSEASRGGGQPAAAVWQPEIDELAHRQALAAEMGGVERVARQRAAGKLTIRDRLSLVCDPGSFHEVGSTSGVGSYDEAGRLVSFLPANLLCGVAEINGRPALRSPLSGALERAGFRVEPGALVLERADAPG